MSFEETYMAKKKFNCECPRCGGNMSCGRDTRVFETVWGSCDECGFEYHTTASLLSLEEINKIRKKVKKEPLLKRREPQISWTSRFTGKGSS